MESEKVDEKVDETKINKEANSSKAATDKPVVSQTSEDTAGAGSSNDYRRRDQAPIFNSPEEE
jgi:hypothetical protein